MADRDPARAERIQRLRADLGLTQRALGELVGVKERTVQQWEAGGNLEWDNAIQLARVAKTQPQWIQAGPGPDPPPPDEELTLEAVSTRIMDALTSFGTELRDLRERRRGSSLRGGYDQVSKLVATLRGSDPHATLTGLREDVQALTAVIAALVAELQGRGELGEGAEPSGRSDESEEEGPEASSR